MQVKPTIWFGVASFAVATWLTAASTTDVRPPAPIPSPEGPSDLDRSAARLQSEIARLHERLGPTAVPEGRRDLFRFSSRPPRRPRAEEPRSPDVVTAAPVPGPAIPVSPLTLIGIAEDVSPDGPVRTAIVSGLGDVFLVKAGDSIVGRFRVESVGAASVELTDVATSAPSALALR